MNCKNCNTPLSKEQVYCPNCGTPTGRSGVEKRHSNQMSAATILICCAILFGVYFLTRNESFGRIDSLFGKNREEELQEMESSMEKIGDQLDTIQDSDTQQDAEAENAQSSELTVGELIEPPKEIQPKTKKEQKDPVEPREYVLPGSDARYITEADLAGFSAHQCRLARNELYARHGRIFNDKNLQAYFEQFSWYNGRILSDEFPEGLLNKYEQYNRDVIVKYEKKKGYR